MARSVLVERPSEAPPASTNGKKPTPTTTKSGRKAKPQKRPRYASIAPGPSKPLPPAFADAVKSLEKVLGMPVWLLLQASDDESRMGSLGDGPYRAFRLAKSQLPNTEIALLIDSPGGFAKSAWQIASLLQSKCGRFTAVVPRSAKSAATLLALGADTLVLGDGAELGPIDAQYFDHEQEKWISALNDVQALERLHAFALEACDRTMTLLTGRTRKRVDTLLPMSLRFATDLVRPLFEKIDAVHYSEMSRALKVAEEYAVRLMQQRYTVEDAQKIARKLVENYPDHAFVVDAREAKSLGLKITASTARQQAVFETMIPHLGRLTAIGVVKEVTQNGQTKP